MLPMAYEMISFGRRGGFFGAQFICTHIEREEDLALMNSLYRWTLFAVYFAADGMLCYFSVIVFIRQFFRGRYKVRLN